MDRLSVARANGYGVARMDFGQSPKASRSYRLLQIQQSGEPDSAGTLMRYKPKSRAALHIALDGLPEEMRVEVDSGHPGVGKYRWRTAGDDGMAREFGDNNAAGTQCGKRHKGEQS